MNMENYGINTPLNVHTNVPSTQQYPLSQNHQHPIPKN